MRLLVDLFIKYVYKYVYSDNNHGQPHSILNIFLTLFFFVGRDENEWVGGIFYQNKTFFYLVGSPKVGGAGDGKHKKKYGHPNAKSWISPFSKSRIRPMHTPLLADFYDRIQRRIVLL